MFASPGRSNREDNPLETDRVGADEQFASIASPSNMRVSVAGKKMLLDSDERERERELAQTEMNATRNTEEAENIRLLNMDYEQSD